MLGLALEGGGSRGSYHIGVVKAYLEEGYVFDGFVGTSIGAINAAILAQGDFEKLLELWLNLSTEALFDTDERSLIKIGESKWDMNILTNVRNSLRKVIDDGGIDTSQIKAIAGKYIDEQKVRGSSKDFGLVTVSISERKPYELFLEDIPQGGLLSYILASACFPGFKSEIIGENSYIDGALYNNCPVNMLLKKGYDEIIAVRTKAPGIYRRISPPAGAKVTVIVPDDDLGNVMLFSPEKIRENINLGYFDGLRVLRGLRGRYYYLEPAVPDESFAHFAVLDDNIILEAGKVMGASEMPAKRMLFEYIIPKLGSRFKLKKDFGYADFAVALLEDAAQTTGIERCRLYSYHEFISLIKQMPPDGVETANPLMAVIPDSISPLKYKTAAQLILQGFLRTAKNG